jgi:hypothetical protein
MQKIRPHWRKMTWALIGWTGLMGWWLISYVAESNCSDQVGKYQNAKQTGCEAGTSIGIFMILIVAFLGFVVLGMIWLMSRRRT